MTITRYNSTLSCSITTLVSQKKVPTMTTTTTAQKVVCGVLSFAAGAWAFFKTQEVTKESFEPLLGNCSSSDYQTVDEFVEATGYHAYDPSVGFVIFKPFVCLITQFLHQLTAQYPAGLLTWMSTMLAAFPMGVLVVLEAGRQGNGGPLLYPTVLGLLYQFLGVSVIFPLIWVPSFCIWGSNTGSVALTRARAAFPLSLPALALSVSVFVLDTDSDAWALCAGILGGPMLPLIGLVLYFVGPPVAMSKDQAIKSARTAALAYGAAGAFALIGWFCLAYVVVMEYGTDYTALWNDVWAQANSSVKFMAIDASVLWAGVVLHIASRSLFSFAEAVILTPFFGPGASCAMALAGMEMDRMHALVMTMAKDKKTE